MKKILPIFTILFLLATVAIGISFAQEDSEASPAADNVFVPEEKVIEGNYLKVGDTVTILGTVTGDVIVAGGEVRIKGVVEGDVIAVGGNIRITGEVKGNVVGGAGTVDILGTVGQNVRVGAGVVTISGKIGRNVLVGAGQLMTEKESIIEGTLTAGAGDIQLNGTVKGNVDVATDTLTLLPNSATTGNLTYLSEKPFVKEEGALIEGRTTHHVPALPEAEPKLIYGIFRPMSLAMFAFVVLSQFLVGLVFVSFAPRQSIALVNLLIEKPLHTLLLGTLMLVGIPILAVVLLVTIIGIPLSLLLIFSYFAALYITPIFFSLLVGIKTIKLYNKTYDTEKLILPLFVGVVIMSVITRFVFLGPLISFIALLATLGGASLLIKEAASRLSGRI